MPSRAKIRLEETPLSPDRIPPSTKANLRANCSQHTHPVAHTPPRNSPTHVKPFNTKILTPAGNQKSTTRLCTEPPRLPCYRPCRRALKRETRAGATGAFSSNNEPAAPGACGFSTTVSRKALPLAFDLAVSSLRGTATALAPAACLVSGAPGVAAGGARVGRFAPPPRKPFFHWGPRDGLAAAPRQNHERRRWWFPYISAKVATKAKSTDQRYRRAYRQQRAGKQTYKSPPAGNGRVREGRLGGG